jgi:hypothetical protein
MTAVPRLRRGEVVKNSEREAIAYHEAGHAVAAWRQRVKIKSATIIPASDYLGQIKHVSPLNGVSLEYDGSDRARIRAESAIILCLAGPSAQRRFNPRSVRSYHATSDHEIAADLVNRLDGNERSANAHLKWLSLVTDDLIALNWREVEGIALALLERGELSGNAIARLLAPV